MKVALYLCNRPAKETLLRRFTGTFIVSCTIAGFFILPLSIFFYHEQSPCKSSTSSWRYIC